MPLDLTGFTTGIVRRDPLTKLIHVEVVNILPSFPPPPPPGPPPPGDFFTANVTGIDWDAGITPGPKFPFTPPPPPTGIALGNRATFTADVSTRTLFEIQISGENPPGGLQAWAWKVINVFALDKQGHIVPGNTFSQSQLTFLNFDHPLP